MPMQQHTQTLNEMEVDLLKGMTALDPNKRISAKMALLHPYFDTLDKSKLPFTYEEVWIIVIYHKKSLKEKFLI